MTTARERRGNTSIQSMREENWSDVNSQLSEAISEHIKMLEKTNQHLAILADCASETISLIKKVFKVYIPWAIAALAVAYPTIGKIIQSLPLLTPIG
jgi:phage-related minor tail protein